MPRTIEYETMGGEKRTVTLPDKKSRSVASETPYVPLHCRTVTLPDGTPVQCDYRRNSSRWHELIYRLEGVHLAKFWSKENVGRGLGPVVSLMDRAGKECFERLVKGERKRFNKASLPPFHTADPATYQMTAAQAKERGGLYALCEPRKEGQRSTTYYPIIALSDSLTEAVEAWQRVENKSLVICGCHRVKRCWLPLRWNPLHARDDYPKEEAIADNHAGGD